jgi:hypothetical protein
MLSGELEAEESDSGELRAEGFFLLIARCCLYKRVTNSGGRAVFVFLPG